MKKHTTYSIIPAKRWRHFLIL